MDAIASDAAWQSAAQPALALRAWLLLWSLLNSTTAPTSTAVFRVALVGSQTAQLPTVEGQLSGRQYSK